jgi:hypothetical protein
MIVGNTVSVINFMWNYASEMLLRLPFLVYNFQLANRLKTLVEFAKIFLAQTFFLNHRNLVSSIGASTKLIFYQNYYSNYLIGYSLPRSLK